MKLRNRSVVCLITFIVFICCVKDTKAFKHFRSHIPNGFNVIDPCSQGLIWYGVGHLNCQGDGELNQFGMDFDLAKMVWTRDLCLKDSDGDGMTNGMELGDPDCVWVYNVTTNPSRTFNITHPGRANNANTCEDKSFVCVRNLTCNVDNNIEVKNTTLSTKFTVDLKTEHFSPSCFAFELPTLSKYDIIGYAPVVSNIHLPYYMVLYACDSNTAVTPNMEAPGCRPTGPYGCNITIAVWTSDSIGRCFANKGAFAVDASSPNYNFKYAVLQVHIMGSFEGPMQLEETMGFTLFYTPTSQAQKIQTLEIFQTTLNIPANTASFVATGVCSANCTRKEIMGPVYITEAIVLMHSSGRKGTVTVKKTNGSSFVIFEFHEYEEESPYFKGVNLGFGIEAGDEISLKCEYSNMGTSHSHLPVFTSLGAQGDMCAAYLTYYSPQQPRFISCGQQMEMSYCSDGWTAIPGCDMNSFLYFANLVKTACNPQNCSLVCINYVDYVRKSGCLNVPSVTNYIKATDNDLYNKTLQCTVELGNCNLNEALSSIAEMNILCSLNSCNMKCFDAVSALNKTGCFKTNLLNNSNINPKIISAVEPIFKISNVCTNNICSVECINAVNSYWNNSDCYMLESAQYFTNYKGSSLFYLSACNNVSVGCSLSEAIPVLSEMNTYCKDSMCSFECNRTVGRLRQLNCSNVNFFNRVIAPTNSLYNNLTIYFNSCNALDMSCNNTSLMFIQQQLEQSCREMMCSPSCSEALYALRNTNCNIFQINSFFNAKSPDLLFYINNCSKVCKANDLIILKNRLVSECLGDKCTATCLQLTNTLQTYPCPPSESKDYIVKMEQTLYKYLNICYLVFPYCNTTDLYNEMIIMEKLCPLTPYQCNAKCLEKVSSVRNYSCNKTYIDFVFDKSKEYLKNYYSSCYIDDLASSNCNTKSLLLYYEQIERSCDDSICSIDCYNGVVSYWKTGCDISKSFQLFNMTKPNLIPKLTKCNYTMPECNINRVITAQIAMRDVCKNFECSPECKNEVAMLNNVSCSFKNIEYILSSSSNQLLFYWQNCTTKVKDCYVDSIKPIVEMMLLNCKNSICTPQCTNGAIAIRNQNCQDYVKDRYSELEAVITFCGFCDKKKLQAIQWDADIHCSIICTPRCNELMTFYQELGCTSSDFKTEPTYLNRSLTYCWDGKPVNSFCQLNKKAELIMTQLDGCNMTGYCVGDCRAKVDNLYRKNCLSPLSFDYYDYVAPGSSRYASRCLQVILSAANMSAAPSFLPLFLFVCFSYFYSK